MYGDDAKYIMIRNDGKGYDEPIVFPVTMDHSFVARRMVREDLGDKIVSAGKVNSRLCCHGESVSLKIKSRKEDTSIMLRAFGTDEEDMGMRMN